MKTKILLVAILGMFFSIAVQAAEQKIAIVDPRLVLSKLPQAEAVSTKLKNEFSERQEKLKLLSEEITALQTKGQRDAPTMSESEVTNLQRQLESKISSFKLDEKSFKEDFTRRQKEELRKLQTKVFEAINAVSKQEGYDLVLAREAVFYAIDGADISNKVLQYISNSK